MFIALNNENFEKEIFQAEKPVLVDFWLPNCPPCSLITPVLEKLAREFKEKIIFAKANFNEASSAVQKYGLTAAPTVILFKKGRPESGFVGLRQEEEIRKWLKAVLENNEKQQ